MTTAPDISLPRFEGPLDLLLDLVRTHKIEIHEIPIAEITRQYLEYLHRAEQLDIELGAEFAYIAALLIHIKSRSLLASDPELPAREEDPRQELIRLLLDHDQVRHGAEFLKQKLELARKDRTSPSIQEQSGAMTSMTAPAGKAFFDTNILLYMYGGGDAAKTRRAAAMFTEYSQQDRILLSTQVVQEFYAVALRKVGMPRPTLRTVFATLLDLPLVLIAPSQIRAAVEYEERYQISFWDALIIAAAESGGGDLLFTEDLNHGQRYGAVLVQNPFIADGT